MVERGTLTADVVGSNPASPATYISLMRETRDGERIAVKIKGHVSVDFDSMTVKFDDLSEAFRILDERCGK